MPDDFEGGFKPSIRWNSELATDQLTYNQVNEFFERESEPIELNCSASTFIMDTLTREHGRVRIATGVYKALFAPVGMEVPPIPEDELPFANDYRPGLGCDLWNARYDLVRIESNARYVCAAIHKVWREFAREPEAAQGMVPVIRFIGCHRVSPKNYPNKIYYPPIIERVGSISRQQVPEFAVTAATVPPPVRVENDNALGAALRARLEAPKPRREETVEPKKTTRKPPKKRDDFDDDIEDLAS